MTDPRAGPRGFSIFIQELVGAGVLHKFGGFSKEQDGNLGIIMKTDQERKKAQGAGGGASVSRGCGGIEREAIWFKPSQVFLCSCLLRPQPIQTQCGLQVRQCSLFPAFFPWLLERE